MAKEKDEKSGIKKLNYGKNKELDAKEEVTKEDNDSIKSIPVSSSAVDILHNVEEELDVDGKEQLEKETHQLVENMNVELTNDFTVKEKDTVIGDNSKDKATKEDILLEKEKAIISKNNKKKVKHYKTTPKDINQEVEDNKVKVEETNTVDPNSTKEELTKPVKKPKSNKGTIALVGIVGLMVGGVVAGNYYLNNSQKSVDTNITVVKKPKIDHTHDYPANQTNIKPIIKDPNGINVNGDDVKYYTDFDKISPTKLYNRLTTKVEGDDFFVYFGRPNCPYCRRFLPLFLDARLKNKDNLPKIYYINTFTKGYNSQKELDAVAGLRDVLDITGVPTLVKVEVDKDNGQYNFKLSKNEETLYSKNSEDIANFLLDKE